MTLDGGWEQIAWPPQNAGLGCRALKSFAQMCWQVADAETEQMTINVRYCENAVG